MSAADFHNGYLSKDKHKDVCFQSQHNGLFSSQYWDFVTHPKSKKSWRVNKVAKVLFPKSQQTVWFVLWRLCSAKVLMLEKVANVLVSKVITADCLVCSIGTVLYLKFKKFWWLKKDAKLCVPKHHNGLLDSYYWDCLLHTSNKSWLLKKITKIIISKVITTECLVCHIGTILHPGFKKFW